MRSLLVAAAIGAVHGKTAAEWKSRAVYQILTDRYYRSNGNTTKCTALNMFCGGDFKGIQQNLNYIKGMGFDAIWISPIPQNEYPYDYHGYGALNWE